jgi:hypothetical protein
MPNFYFRFSVLVAYFPSVKMSAGGKCKTLILQEKMEVLNKLDHSASIQSVMNEYGVSRSILYYMKGNRKRTLEFMLKQDNPRSDQAEKRKRKTGPKQNKINEAV